MAAPRIGSRGPWFWATRQAKACIKSSPERKGQWMESEDHWMKSDDLHIPNQNVTKPRLYLESIYCIQRKYLENIIF